eukprot:7256782-Prymnesium_polylepis.3
MSQVAIGVLIPYCIRDPLDPEMNQIYEILLEPWQRETLDGVEWVDTWYFQEDPTGRTDPDCDLGNNQAVNMAQVAPVVGTRLHDLYPRIILRA